MIKRGISVFFLTLSICIFYVSSSFAKNTDEKIQVAVGISPLFFYNDSESGTTLLSGQDIKISIPFSGTMVSLTYFTGTSWYLFSAPPIKEYSHLNLLYKIDGLIWDFPVSYSSGISIFSVSSDNGKKSFIAIPLEYKIYLIKTDGINVNLGSFIVTNFLRITFGGVISIGFKI